MIDRYLRNGYPIISDKLVLKKSLVKPGILTDLQNAVKNKIQNGIRSSEKQTDGYESYFDSLNDIRKENWGVKTGCFEDVIYFDVFESLDMIVDRYTIAWISLNYDLEMETRSTKKLMER